ncbi:MAG: C2H2-type zinc finger protein [Promethearchaeota archaeon]
MVLQEFSIQETVSPFELVSNEFYSPQQNSARLQRKRKLKRIPCPICGKRVKGSQALSQHTRSKHPNSLRKKNKKKNDKQKGSIATASSTQNGIACPTCGMKFSTNDGIYAHFCSKHQFSSVVLDENLSSTVSQVRQTAKLFKIIILPFPEQLHGKADNRVLDKLVEMKTGLITRDKYFAKKAAIFIAPVFLLWKNTIIKIK